MPLAFALLSLVLAGPSRAADHVVFIGDSHSVGAFGAAIESWLAARPGVRYDFFASGGSAPRQWAETRFTTTCGFHQTSSTSPRKTRKCYDEPTPHLDELWRQQGLVSGKVRKVTIIAHGTNYPVGDKKSEVKTTKVLLKQAFAASDVCLWVGPPIMRRKGFQKAEMDQRYAIIQDSLDQAAAEFGRRCLLIDSRPLATYPEATGDPKKDGDGVHFPGGAGTKWGTAVAARLESLLK